MYGFQLGFFSNLTVVSGGGLNECEVIFVGGSQKCDNLGQRGRGVKKYRKKRDIIIEYPYR